MVLTATGQHLAKRARILARARRGYKERTRVTPLWPRGTPPRSRHPLAPLLQTGKLLLPLGRAQGIELRQSLRFRATEALPGLYLDPFGHPVTIFLHQRQQITVGYPSRRPPLTEAGLQCATGFLPAPPDDKPAMPPLPPWRKESGRLLRAESAVAMGCASPCLAKACVGTSPKPCEQGLPRGIRIFLSRAGRTRRQRRQRPGLRTRAEEAACSTDWWGAIP